MASNLRVPPRFVPTLTAVLEVPPEPVEEPATDDLAATPEPVPIDMVAIRPGQLSDDDAFRLEEQLLHRVLQRIDLQLEERLSDTVSAAVQQQLDAMLPRLRGEIESVLRTLVIESLAQELSENTGSVPASEPGSLG
ncbi:hypothetical protein [Variovorax sp. PAMC 28711]|uniref:hypothetical protein n=1 Tax=Variovorax sp. PAMC 28711 TaxID=1795631 RepID=UPI00078E706C|nr:hypothetical protein [Variovorax sp. PAMC 28711]AMM26284.1 hypothetical protein AX767_19440 [Variovorax sp. PAMC 28711]